MFAAEKSNVLSTIVATQNRIGLDLWKAFALAYLKMVN